MNIRNDAGIFRLSYCLHSMFAGNIAGSYLTTVTVPALTAFSLIEILGSAYPKATQPYTLWSFGTPSEVINSHFARPPEVTVWLCLF